MGLTVYLVDPNFQNDDIKIGLLVSLSGENAEWEKPLVSIAQFAIDEINQSGGVLGQNLRLIVRDTKSDSSSLIQEAKNIILKDKVSVLFACLNSNCLNLLRPIVEENRSLLFFPGAYEGQEKSPHIIYLGQVPNQQISHGVSWAIESIGRKSYFVGQKNTRSLISQKIARDILQSHNGSVLAEKFISSEEFDFARLAEDIKIKNPDFIFNTIVGVENKKLLQALINKGITRIPIVTMQINEAEAMKFQANQFEDHFSLVGYFQSIDSPTNESIVKNFHNQFGTEVIINDTMESLYSGIGLWIEAVKYKRTADPMMINDEVLLRQSFDSPSGLNSIDTKTRHMWKLSRVSRITDTGEFVLVRDSQYTIRPNPWPSHRTKEEWESLIAKANTIFEGRQ